jgi:hypothetical protein
VREFRVCAVLAALLAAACAEAPRDAGYADGCRSGYFEAGREGYQYNADFRQDAALYATDGEYRRGWDQGRSACIEEQRLAPRIMPGPHG